MSSSTVNATGVRPDAGTGNSIRSPRSISEGLAGHSNSFGVIRLVLASAVIFSHAFPLGGWGEDPLLKHTMGQQNIGGVAVLGFFAISGYLIAKSGMNSDALQFIWRRVLRIFPAYFLVLIVAAFVVGPIAWVIVGHSLGSYYTFSDQGPFHYLIANADLTMRQYGVYDIFATTTPYGAIGGPVFNGSLWTLTYEFGSYLIIFVLVLFGILRRAKVLVLVLTAFYFIAQIATVVVPGGGGRVIPYFADDYRVALPLIFLYGSCLAIYSKRVLLDWRLATLAAIIAALSLWKGGLTIVGYPAIAYLIIWLAAVLPSAFHWIGRKNDYSYGIYVYGFLVEQFTAFFGWYKWGYLPWSLTCLVISAGCAWLSWHGVEKRALSLKDFGPGKGVRYWRDAFSRRRSKKTLAPVDRPVSSQQPSTAPAE